MLSRKGGAKDLDVGVLLGYFTTQTGCTVTSPAPLPDDNVTTTLKLRKRTLGRLQALCAAENGRVTLDWMVNTLIDAYDPKKDRKGS